MGVDYQARAVIGIKLNDLKYERREIETTRYDPYTGKPYPIKDWQHGVVFNDKFYDLYDKDYDDFVIDLESHYGLPFHPTENDNTIYGFIGYGVPSAADTPELARLFEMAKEKLGDAVRLHTYLYIDA